MKLKQRKQLAARIRNGATDAKLPLSEPYKSFRPHESDVVILEGGLSLRLRNSPLALERFAKTVERGEPWRAANGGALKPNIPDIDAIVDFYGSAAKAKEKIAEHLAIQGDYMEKGQVKACEKKLQYLEWNAEKIDNERFLRTVPKNILGAGEMLAKDPAKMSEWVRGELPAVRKRFEADLADYCNGDTRMEFKIRKALGL